MQRKIQKANNFLGRTYCIEGIHIKGNGIGKKAFPTINVKIDNFLLPQDGVYITKTIINQKAFKSVSFLGKRLSIDNKLSVETHL